MAATASASFSMLGWVGGRRGGRRHKPTYMAAQQQQTSVEQQQQQQELPKEQTHQQQEEVNVEKQQPLPRQDSIWNAKSKNMRKEYGGQWLSSCTRHVRIYAAYIDPVTYAFDQTQMDKLTLILDPTNEFVWNPETCNKVYAYFQELVDHYEV